MKFFRLNIKSIDFFSLLFREGAIDRLVEIYKKAVYNTGVCIIHFIL